MLLLNKNTMSLFSLYSTSPDILPSITQLHILPYWDTYTDKIRRCEISVIGCITWCVGGCECFSQSQYTHCPEQTVAYCNWLELWEFIKFTIQILNAQISERFTDHQGILICPQIPQYIKHTYEKTHTTIKVNSTSREYTCNFSRTFIIYHPEIFFLTVN